MTTIPAAACAFVLLATTLPLSVAAQAETAPQAARQGYVAMLTPLNTSITGLKTDGEARFNFDGDEMIISIKVKDAQPGEVHWQHFHGFTDNHAASCPDASADVNHDGVIDIVETEKAAGTTMVPFDADPAGMDVAHGTYPRAGDGGSYEYESRVSMKALDKAFRKAFTDADLDLDRRVVMIHGVSEATKLPSTVASLGTIPARITLPIACGRIVKAAAPR